MHWNTGDLGILVIQATDEVLFQKRTTNTTNKPYLFVASPTYFIHEVFSRPLAKKSVSHKRLVVYPLLHSPIWITCLNSQFYSQKTFTATFQTSMLMWIYICTVRYIRFPGSVMNLGCVLHMCQPCLFKMCGRPCHPS